jgi:hypothetical protein
MSEMNVPITLPGNVVINASMTFGQNGVDGKSAYQSYLDTTADDPPLSEADWSAGQGGGDGSGATPSQLARITALESGLADITLALASDDLTLDELQEIVNFIKINRADLDALSIASIAGLADALAGKAAQIHAHALADVTGLVAALAGKAPLESPALTGSPTAPTAGASENSTSIATTAFVQSLAALRLLKSENLSDLANIATARANLGLGTAALSASTAFAAAVHSHASATTSVAGFMSSADKIKLNGIATAATANATNAQLRDRGTHTGSQTSGTISDFGEAVDDRVAQLLSASTNITLNYDDAANQLSISAAGGSGGAADPEEIRDVIGVALVAAGLLNVSINDAADTITISTTATQNQTDAYLLDLANATGFLPVAKVSGLGTAATADAGDFAEDSVIGDYLGEQTLSFGATVTQNAALGTQAKLVATADYTLAVPTNIPVGSAISGSVRVTNSGGQFVLTLAAGWDLRSDNATLPAVTPDGEDYYIAWRASSDGSAAIWLS